jgi:hypothetical protein
VTIVRTRGGWAVQFEDGTRTEAMTRRAAGERMQFVTKVRADQAAAEAEASARTARLLAQHGIELLDYRQLRQGDLFTWRPEVPPKVVTEAQHFDNGGSLIFWEPGKRTPRHEALTLMTPGYPAYGRITASSRR